MQTPTQPSGEPIDWVVKVRAKDTAEMMGCAVAIGYGNLLTAAHLFQPEARAASVVVGATDSKDDPRAGLYLGENRKHLASRDLALLALDAPLPAAAPTSTPNWARIKRLDRWAKLKACGWLGGSWQELSCTVGEGSHQPPGVTSDLFQLNLATTASGSLQGLSGGGVFDEMNALVGIISHEDNGADGARRLYFSPFDDEHGLGILLDTVQYDRIPDQDSLPKAWEQSKDLQSVAPPFDRDVIIDTIRETIHGAEPAAQNENGKYLVLLGGPKRGKTAIMAELIRRVGRAQTPWLLFSRTSSAAAEKESGLLSAETRLIQQITYLLGHPDTGRSADGGSPGTVLRGLLETWRRQRRTLVIYLDALDELPGAESVPFLPDPLPTGVFVVVSLQHEPHRRAFLTLPQRCLGVIDLDAGRQDLLGVNYLVPSDVITQSSGSAIDRIWDAWERADPKKKLPDDLRAAIYNQGENTVGYHEAYQRALTSRLASNEPLPKPGDVPEVKNIDQFLWDEVTNPSKPQQEATKRLLGLVAFARQVLTAEQLRKLAGIPDKASFNEIVNKCYACLRWYDTLGDRRVYGHHPEWNRLVRDLLAGDTASQINWRLAEGVEDWPMKELDEDYWLRNSPSHLMQIIEDHDAPPRCQKDAQKAWRQRMDDPCFLADRAACSGVDSLLSDLNAGIVNLPHSRGVDWYDAWVVLNRDAWFLRAYSNTGSADSE